MTKRKAFISHTTQDDDFVKLLRQALESHGVEVWTDSRKLVGGDILEEDIEKALASVNSFFLVISNNSLAHPRWVKKETQMAQAIQAECGADGYPIVPILYDGLGEGALEHFFEKTPLAIKIPAGGLQKAVPELLAALGLRLPDDPTPAMQPPEPPVNELLFVLENPELYTEGGVRRGKARAHFEMQAADGGEKIETEPFDFICPLGPIEAGRMKWYIEDYPQAPFLEKILDRGAAHEKEMVEWGKNLFDTLTEPRDARELFWEWKGDNVHERRFSVKFNFFNEKNLPPERLEAINVLMATPWEILHDGQGYLFQGKKPVRVRRRIPNKGRKANLELRDKLRVLLLSPRPVDKQAGYIDHRVAPKALLAAIEPLGDRAELTLLRQPTFPALCAAIKEAEAAGQPFSVVHFDGHGVFDAHKGLGALCFESAEPGEQQKLEGRKTHVVYADELLAELRGYRIPFFFLDACQSAMAEKDPTASVAATLLETGAASVAAMSYSVLVSTAEVFAKAFYAELAKGARIGSAMLAGQRALHENPVRAELPQGEKLRLHDWFVPVLFQEEKDPRLVKEIPGAQTRKVAEDAREAHAGDTPPEPSHGFIGRHFELLALERLLLLERYAVLVGQGGAGKTTLATELARWMLRTGRFARLAFVSFENLRDVRSALDALGRQLEGSDFSVAAYKDEEAAMLVLDRRLREYPTLIVLDNLESVLPLPGGEPLLGVESIENFTTFFSRLLKSSDTTRLLLTTRETLPAPFDTGRNHRRTGPLAPEDALRLIAEVMKKEGIEVPSLNVEDLDAQFGALARTANYHARAITLLTKTLAERGDALPELNTDLSHLMAELERKNPGERENSLFASLELSLRRLPPEVRTVVDALAVYHGGADVATWAMVAEQDQDVIAHTGLALATVGLAELVLAEFPYFFKIDPALPVYLSARISQEMVETWNQRWLEGMILLSDYLYRQQGQNTHLAYDLARLSEANLLAMLAALEKEATPDQLVENAQAIENLFSRLSRPQVVEFAQKIRIGASKQLGDRSRANYLNKSAVVDRFLEQGNLNAAFTVAMELYDHCEKLDSLAYPEAEDDKAMANFKLGRVLSMGGQSEQALPFLETAQMRFLSIAKVGDTRAERMVSACMTEIGDCFVDLGQYDAAVQYYELGIAISEKLNDLRGVAVKKGQLATARMWLNDYPEALRLFTEAKIFFERTNEPASVAAIWHQIGRVHEEAKNYPAAEKAYQNSLAIEIREKNKAGEASSLGQLGNFYDSIGRSEDSIRMIEQAIAIYVELKDIRYEGVSRNNLANTLLKLHRTAEARSQLILAIKCKSQFGHTATPWTTWAILNKLETTEGNTTAAADARQKAIQAYTAYRKDGGKSRNHRFNLIAATEQALQNKQEKELIQHLESTIEPDDPITYIALIKALISLLQGSHSPSLADDPDLDYMDAVDLRMTFFKSEE